VVIVFVTSTLASLPGLRKHLRGSDELEFIPFSHFSMLGMFPQKYLFLTMGKKSDAQISKG
jgi:hypothetical protein